LSKKLLIVATCMTVTLGFASSAEAAFPGTNGKIVFSNRTGIASANPDGGAFAQLTTNGETTFDSEPAWNAEGSKIVFDRIDFGSTFSEQIWTMNPDGSGAAPVDPTQTAPLDFNPAFFPDGRIVFTRQGTGQDNDDEIWAMNADGSGQTNLTDNSVQDFSPTVSPDGKSIAFSSNASGGGLSIFRMGPTGANVSLVTTDHPGGEAYCDVAPDYSPDGKTIAFQREVGDCFPAVNLFTVPAGGGAATALTFATEFGQSFALPAYSPDGTQIVFANEPPPVSKEPAADITPQDAPLAGQLGFIPASGGQTQTYLDGTAPDWQPIPVKTDLGACFRRKVTIAGTPGPDKIAGTPGNDVIRGFQGKDKINGKGGDDILCGGRGQDKLFGKGADDILIGGAQSDYLNGGKGSNKLFGGTPGAHPEEADNVCVQGKDDKLSNCQTVK
jgi:Tol biopolymer transport system component